MQKKLIVAEKPSVAAEIAEALGGFDRQAGVYERGDLVVTAARGHLVAITAPPTGAGKGWDLQALPEIPEQFDLAVLPKADDDFRRLQSLMGRKDITGLINACDAGREGELIFRLIYEKAGCNKPLERMWIQSMTTSAILQAYKGLRAGREFDALYDAARSRAEADWLIGVNGTRGVTSLVELQTGVAELSSVGRVQTPTLAYPVFREREIQSFRSSPFWEVHANFGIASGQYKGECAEVLADGSAKVIRFEALADAKDAMTACETTSTASIEEQTTRKETAAPRLYDLTTLQRVANTTHKLTAMRTLELAQALYEKKLITYPRTDSDSLPVDYRANATVAINSLFDSEWDLAARLIFDQGLVERAGNRVFNDERVTDHFAIIPSGEAPAKLQGEEALVYGLVASRFLSAFLPPAVHDEVVRITRISNYAFRSTGRVVVDPGWQAVDQAESAQAAIHLPMVSGSEHASVLGISLHEGATTPPKRYTEATLLSAMEGAAKQVEDAELRSAMRDTGLGRPATRAGIIEHLMSKSDSRGKPRQPYLERQGTMLIPTAKAMDLIARLESTEMVCLVSPTLTGDWEWRLARIEAGQDTRADFMDGIRTLTRELVANLQKQATATPARRIAERCVLCGTAGPVEAIGSSCVCKHCGARASFDVARRRLDDRDLKQLFENGRTQLLEGFLSKAGKTFKAVLVLKPDLSGVSFEFPPDEPATTDQKCPDCADALAATPRSLKCASCGFTLWTEILGRQLKPQEVAQLLSDGQTKELKGFKSAKTKKPFSASLVLEKGGRVKFAFSE